MGAPGHPLPAGLGFADGKPTARKRPIFAKRHGCGIDAKRRMLWLWATTACACARERAFIRPRTISDKQATKAMSSNSGTASPHAARGARIATASSRSVGVNVRMKIAVSRQQKRKKKAQAGIGIGGIEHAGKPRRARKPSRYQPR